jgi:uncharacterized protein YyaL (SSP411 family)
VPGARNELSDLVRSTFVPASVVISGTGSSPLLTDREAGVAYLCRGRVCDLPARTVSELARQLSSVTGR